jgi:hypothetical protein
LANSYALCYINKTASPFCKGSCYIGTSCAQASLLQCLDASKDHEFCDSAMISCRSEANGKRCYVRLTRCPKEFTKNCATHRCSIQPSGPTKASRIPGRLPTANRSSDVMLQSQATHDNVDCPGLRGHDFFTFPSEICRISVRDNLCQRQCHIRLA